MLSSTACPDNSGKSRTAGKTFIQNLFFFLMVTQICFGQWYQQNSGTTKNLHAVQFINSNTGWVVGDSGTILKTIDGGFNWNIQTSGTNHSLLDVQFESTNLGWAAGGTGEFWNPDSAILLKTINGGLTWVRLLSIKGKFYDVCFTDEYNGHLVGSGEDIFGQIRPIYLRTTDGGNAWISQYYNENFLSTVDFIDNNTGWLVEIIYGGFGCYRSVIRKTIDGGMNWEIQDTNYAVYKIKSLNSDFICGIGSTSLGELSPPISNLARTYDGGANWTDELINGMYNRNGLNDISISSINVLTAVGFWDSTYYGDLYGSVLRSTDSGNTWSMQTFNQTEMLNGISFVGDYTGWIVGNNGTILHTTNGGVSFVEEEQIDEVPSEFLLSQNYPNPFNPSTKIKYSVPQPSQVQIKVFDVLGNEIETLVSEEKPTGTYEITWNAASLPSGVYFYQLQAGEFIQSKKMILIK